MTTVGEDLEQARVDGLLGVLRDAEAELRRSYSRMLGVVGELEEENAGAAAGFGTTARLLAGVLNLSRGEAKARVEQAELLTPRRSLTGEVLPPILPATAAELAAGAIGPAHLRVITATMRRIPDGTHPDTAAQAEQTLATAARRFDPSALTRIGECLLAYLDPDGPEPAEEPETTRELRVRTGADGTVSLDGKLDPEGGARVLEVLGSLNGRRAPIDGVPDTRSQSRRDADALVEAMTRLLDDGELPARGGQRPHLVLTMGLRDLIDGLGSATLDTGGQLSAAEPAVLRAIRAWSPWSSAPTPCPWTSDATSAWPPRPCATHWASGIKDAPFPHASAHPATARRTTFGTGSTGARQSSAICACCASIITPSCTAKAGTSDSTDAVDQN